MGRLRAAWSPDGRTVAFLRVLSRERDGVFLVPSIGGNERNLTEIFSTGLSDCYAWQPAWHPGGRWLVIADKKANDEPFRLVAVSLATGDQRPLTSPPPNTLGDLYPSFSPDGRTLAFSRTFSNNASALYSLQLSDQVRSGQEPQRLTSESFFVGNSAWTPDGRAIVFTGGDYHNPSLWKIELGANSARLNRLVFAGEGAMTPAISRQGLLSYGRESIDTEVWRVNLDNLSTPAIKLISSTRVDHDPQYSPDGKRIAFASNRSGSHELWISNSDGSKAVQLTFLGGFYYRANPHWSPDGQRIYFNYFRQRGRECWVISSDGGTPTPLNDVAEACPTAWSPDGRWAYFDRDGQVWKMPSRGGSPVQVTLRGGTGALPSSDEKSLYYHKTSDDITSLWTVPVKGGEETLVLESVYVDNIAVTTAGIYFVAKFEHSSVQFLSFATGKVERIASIGQTPTWGFAVSPDGRSLLYTTYEKLPFTISC